MMQSKSLHVFLSSVVAKSRAERKPYGAVIELTYGCNLKCVHCLNPTHQALPRELNKQEILGILDEIAAFGVIEITFTGGEMFTRPDIFEILDYAHSLGFVLTILTNATRLNPPTLQRLEKPRVRLEVSVYGTTQKVYESVTGVPGSFDKFMEGIKLLSGSQIPVTMHIPVMTLNRAELSEAKSLAASMKFRFQYCFDVHPRQDGNVDPLQYRLSPEEKISVMNEMGEEASGSCQSQGAAGSERFVDCECGRSKFSITPYGEMNLCTAFPTPKYDLRRGNIREGWEVLKRTVDQAVPNDKFECPSCSVKEFCRQGRSDSWLEKGDMSVCLPHFHRFAGIEKRYHEERRKSGEPIVLPAVR